MHRATRLARHRQRLRDVLHAQMSAVGPKQTWRVALHMSAFGSKADIGRSGLLWREQPPFDVIGCRPQLGKGS